MSQPNLTKKIIIIIIIKHPLHLGMGKESPSALKPAPFQNFRAGTHVELYIFRAQGGVLLEVTSYE